MLELTENITIDDMPTEDLRDIAEMCGVENALKIMESFAGLAISIPTNWQKKLTEKYIRKNYDGTTASIKKICRACKVSRRFVYDFLKVDERQLSIFEEEKDDTRVLS